MWSKRPKRGGKGLRCKMCREDQMLRDSMRRKKLRGEDFGVLDFSTERIERMMQLAGVQKQRRWA